MTPEFPAYYIRPCNPTYLNQTGQSETECGTIMIVTMIGSLLLCTVLCCVLHHCLKGRCKKTPDSSTTEKMKLLATEII